MVYPQGNLPILPLKNSVLFPAISMPLVINRPTSVAALDAALTSEDKFISVFTQSDATVDKPDAQDLFDIGTLAVIKKMIRVDKFLHVEVLGIARVKPKGAAEEKPYLNDSFHYLPDLSESDDSAEAEAIYRAILGLTEKMLKLIQPEMQTGLNYILSEIDNPIKQIYMLGTLMPISVDNEIELLGAETRLALYRSMHAVLEREVQVLELQHEISSQAESKMDKERREYVLRQQLKAIQEQLGEERPEQADVDEFRQQIAELKLPEAILTEVEKELIRLERMSSVSPDYQLTRTYIEFVLALPWNKTTDDRFDLDRAQKILDEDHFDLKDIKERIIEHLAVMKLNPQAKAPILCLVGPPGVGKTSIGQSIARAIGRNFERMSLGGLHDESELRGHRRTYIGAMPGRILQAIRRAGVCNPVLMLDEIDKLGRDFRGDPAAALLEILDPAQNHDFHDNYLDMSFDLSNTFFIATANTLQDIPAPLLDRMEVLRLAGYSDEDKLQIATRYLFPRRLKEAGLNGEQLMLEEGTLPYLIKHYTREAGVRGLERTLGRLVRKVATRVAKGQKESLRVSPELLTELLGPQLFINEQVRHPLSPGVAAGLAWTESGGDVLYVEAALLPGGKGLMLTGQLGDVMQESAKTAHSYIWSNASALGIDQERIRNAGVHVHVPAGAVPKDGPSAGIAMVAALSSLYAAVPARSDTAMTGEITLGGMVLPVGGIKEKVLAAYRAGIYRVVLPEANRKDLAELPEHVAQRMQFFHVTCIVEALSQIVPGLTGQVQRQTNGGDIL